MTPLEYLSSRDSTAVFSLEYGISAERTPSSYRRATAYITLNLFWQSLPKYVRFCLRTKKSPPIASATRVWVPNSCSVLTTRYQSTFVLSYQNRTGGGWCGWGSTFAHKEDDHQVCTILILAFAIWGAVYKVCRFFFHDFWTPNPLRASVSISIITQVKIQMLTAIGSIAKLIPWKKVNLSHL